MNGGIKDLNDVAWADIRPFVARLREAEANLRVAIQNHNLCDTAEIEARRVMCNAQEARYLARKAFEDAVYETVTP